jgi:hypothetical protein
MNEIYSTKLVQNGMSSEAIMIEGPDHRLCGAFNQFVNCKLPSKYFTMPLCKEDLSTVHMKSCF